MSSCSICGNNFKQNERVTFGESIGNPRKLICDIVQVDVLGGSKKSFDLTINSELCRKCQRKIISFYKSLQTTEQLKLELLDLIQTTYDNGKLLDAKAESVATVKVEENFFVNSLEFVDNNTWKDEDNTEEDILANILEQQVKVEVNIGAEDSEDDFVVQDNKSIETDDNESADRCEKVKNKKKSAFVQRKCTQCDEIIKDRSHYQTHMHKYHFSGYVCDHCGQTLRSYTGFRHHLLTHDGEKRFVCNICGNKFTNEVSLKLHMTYHDGVTPFKCDVCSKAFPHKVALRKHKAIHDDSKKKYLCTECDSKFYTKQHLARHMKGHTGLTPFSCHICGKCFTQSYNMKRHVKEHEQPGSTKERRYRCKKCSRTFTNTDNYKKHCEEASCAPKPIKSQNSLKSSLNSLLKL